MYNKKIKAIYKKIFTFSISFVMVLQISSLYYVEARYSDSYSRSAIVSDFDTGRIIYQKNPDKVQSMASISKLMTLLLAFDAINAKEVSEDDKVTIVQSDVNRYGTHMDLNAGDLVSLNELMEGMMLISANDASLAIARYIGGNYENFVKKMNKKAMEIGMKNTKFYNPNGLPEPLNYNGKIINVENKTTARDVLILSKWLYKYYPNRLTAITNKTVFNGNVKKISKENTNPLVSLISNVDGLKTGFTDSAGYCLAYSMKTDKGNGNDVENRLVGVSLGAPSKDARKTTTYNALKYISENYKTKILYKKNSKITNTNIGGLSMLDIGVASRNDVKVVKKITENIDKSFEYYTVSLTDGKDKPIGRMIIKDSYDNIVSEVDLYMEKPISKLPYLDRLKISASAVYSTIFGSDKNGKYPVFRIF